MVGSLENWITLDLEKSGVQGRISARQGDSLVHKIAVRLTIGGRKYMPDSVELAQFYALRPDGSTVFADGRIRSDGAVEFIPGSGFFTYGGPVLCRLVMRGNDGGELYSPAFAIDADPCFAADASAIPTEEYSRLEELFLRTLASQNICETLAKEMRDGAYKTPLSSESPVMDGTASPGVSESAARADHVHPTDTKRMPDISQMLPKATFIDTDSFPVYDNASKKMKRVTYKNLANSIKNSMGDTIADSTAYAARCLYDAATGYYAFLPELTDFDELVVKSQLKEEGVYELIETVTLTEDAKFVRSEEPDGTPYNFDRMFIKFINGDNEQAVNTLGFYDEEDSRLSSVYQTAGTAGHFAGAKIWHENGQWLSEFYAWRSVTSTYMYTYHTGNGNAMLCPVTDTRIRTMQTSGVVAAGLTIEIWGVRADA